MLSGTDEQNAQSMMHVTYSHYRHICYFTLRSEWHNGLVGSAAILILNPVELPQQ